MNSTIEAKCPAKFEVVYTVCEILVAVFAVVGNAMVIIVFRKERRLRRRTNYYIISLAVADFLVGLLGIPFAIMSSIGLPRSLYPCLFTVSLLIVLCTISIFCLVAVSVDRYWAILHPMGYSRNVRTKTALVIISICWLAGTIIGFLPLMGWHKKSEDQIVCCFFLDVMDYNYLVFLYFGTIITPAIILIAFYAHIYRVVVKQLRQIVTMNPENGSSANGSSSGGTMIRVLGAAQTREVKATQNLSIIVLFFMICWVPLYTINCILAFCERCKDVNQFFLLCCIILSHANSAGNPILYAYHLKDFRLALKNFILNLFGHTPPAQGNLPWRASIASNTAFNNFSTNRVQSLRETRSALILSPQYKYSNALCKRESSQSINLPPPTTISALYPIHLGITSRHDVNRDIWRISEVGSTSEEASKEKELECSSLNIKSRRICNISSDSDVNSSQENSPKNCDNTFFKNTFPFADEPEIDSPVENKFDDFSVINKLIRHRSPISISSPQLSRSVFLIEPSEFNGKNFVRSASCTGTEQIPFRRKKSKFKPSEFKHNSIKAINSLLLNPVMKCESVSLSDDDNISLKNMEKNGTVYTFINNSFEC